VRAGLLALVVAGCGATSAERAPAPRSIANAAPTRVEPPGWRWDADRPANAAEAPFHQFRSGGCRFDARKVTCDPGSTRTDFVRWSFAFRGEIAAYAEGDNAFYLVVLAEPDPMLVAVSTVTATQSWQVPVEALPAAPASAHERRIQVHAEGGLVTVSADEDERTASIYIAATGARQAP
jgi:hypothetical protein